MLLFDALRRAPHLADALVLYAVHPSMQHVQGYSGSHWMPPLGNYSLQIALAATGVTENKRTVKKCTNFSCLFGGRGIVPV